jgi:hypothetical protein
LQISVALFSLFASRCATVSAKRKLFLTHAGELAHRLATAIARNGKSKAFVRDYAERYSRIKIIANTERLQEIESTISREALLLVAVDVRRLLSKALASSPANGAGQPPLCDLFYTEFLQSLARTFGWPAGQARSEEQMFAKDLEMYTRWRENTVKLPRRVSSADAGPFPDRCAILLDPAMMFQARRAAVKFQTELLRLGAAIFGRLGRPILQPRNARQQRSRHRSVRGPGTHANSKRRNRRRPGIRHRRR